MKMYYLNLFVWILGLKILSHQAPVTLLRCIFGAKEAALVEVLNTVSLGNPATLQDVLEDNDVSVPINDFILVVFKELFGWSEVRNMDIVSVTYCFHKELQIGAFCKAGELAGIIDTDVDKFLDAGILEQSEELSCVLLGKSYGIKSNHLRHRFRILHRVYSR